MPKPHFKYVSRQILGFVVLKAVSDAEEKVEKFSGKLPFCFSGLGSLYRKVREIGGHTASFSIEDGRGRFSFTACFFDPDEHNDHLIIRLVKTQKFLCFRLYSQFKILSP